MSTATLDAVTFDYWNTLCYETDLDRRRELVADAWRGVLAEAGVAVEHEVLTAAYDAARVEYWEAWHANRQYTGTDAAGRVLAAINGDGSVDHLAGALLDAFHACSEGVDVIAPVEGVDDVLEAVKARGIRVGIICDVGLMASPYLRRHLERLGLLRFFDHWSFSDEVGVYKPDRRIFDHALAGLGGVAPARAAHVGDRRRTDVAGAAGSGMRAVRFSAVYDDTDPAEGPEAHAVVSNYADLVPALGL